MYMWFEEMGLIVLPDIKDKTEFKKRFELLMRRMVTESLAARLKTVDSIDIDEVMR